MYGVDSYQTARSYSQLALYYHTIGAWHRALKFNKRSLFILQTISGEKHPEIASLFLNVGLMMKDMERIHEAISLFKKSLEMSIDLFGEEHVQVANTYQAIAQAYYTMYDFRTALDYQQKAFKLLQGLYKDEGHPYMKQAKLQLDQYLKYSVQSEKIKQQMQQHQRTIGSNKAPTGPMNQQELAQKQQKAWLQKLTNPQRPRNYLELLEQDYMRKQQQKFYAQSLAEKAKKEQEAKNNENPEAKETEDAKKAEA